MKKKTIINHHLRLIASALMLMTAMTAKAIFGTAKYDAYAYPIPSGAGKVYVSTSQTNSPNYQNEIHISGEESFFTNEGDKNFYFYAKANENYVFDYWATYYALFNAGPNYIGEKSARLQTLPQQNICARQPPQMKSSIVLYSKNRPA